MKSKNDYDLDGELVIIVILNHGYIQKENRYKFQNKK